MQAFFKLIRWKNLMMIAAAQLLIKYALLEAFEVETALDTLGISLLILSTICIAAAGNIINDINDIETDFINKPKQIIVGEAISEKTAYNLFIVLNIIGVALGFYLSHLVNKAPFFTIFVLISVLLYIYATSLKQMLLIGNLVISILVALSIIIVGLFDILPVLTTTNQQTQLMFFKIIFDYALFAFTINLLREIAKDIEDIDGDHAAGMHTFPIVIGRDRAKNILIALNFIPLSGIIFYVVTNLYKQEIAVIYFLIFIIAPLIYMCLKTFSAASKSDFHHISNMYKIIMLFGMLSLLLYKFIILN